MSGTITDVEAAMDTWLSLWQYVVTNILHGIAQGEERVRHLRPYFPKQQVTIRQKPDDVRLLSSYPTMSMLQHHGDLLALGDAALDPLEQ